jgi:hypothetical protein
MSSTMSQQPAENSGIVSVDEPHGEVRQWLRMRYVGFALCIPAIILLIGASRREWYPTGDLAHTELMLRSIPKHPPLVGVAARVGTIEDPGSAPGPSMAYLLFPFYLLFGRTSFGLVAALNIVHLLATVAAVAFVWRRHGRLAGLIIALVSAVLIRSLMPDFFLEPWNVWIPVFAFMLYLVVLWGIAMNRSAGLPIAVALGAHVAQTHISYVPLVGGTLAVTVVWIIANRNKMSGRLGGDLLLSFIVGLASLVLPVVEQLRDGTGNLARLWRHFTNPPEEAIGFGAAMRGFFGEYNLLGPWITGAEHSPLDSPNVTGAIAMGALVLSGLAVALFRKDRVALELYGVVGTVTLIGLISVTRIFGEFYDYLLRWIWPINAISVAAALFAWARALTRSEGRDPVPNYSLLSSGAADLGRRPQRDTTDEPDTIELRHEPRYHATAAVLLIATIGTLGLASIQAVGATPKNESDSRLVGALSAQLAPKLTPKLASDSRYLLRWHDPAALGGGAYGLVLELERQGFKVGVDAWGRAAAQPYRVMPEETANSVLWFVSGDISIDKFAARPGAVLLAEFDPRSPADQQRSTEVRAQIEARFIQLGRTELISKLDEQYGTTQIRFFEDLPPDAIALVEEYNDLRVPGAVFEVPTQWGLFIP